MLRSAVQDLGARRGEPRADHPQRPSVGLVGTGRLLAALGQFGQPGGDGDESRRHRQVLLECGEFGQVMRQRGERGAARGLAHHVARHVRIPVAVTADPGTGLQDRRGEQIGAGPSSSQRVPDLGVDLRDHLEERGGVIAQPHLDLVGDLQPRQSDQRGLPEGEDLAAQLALDVAAVVGFGMPLRVQPHQGGDPVLGDEDGATPGFGGVGGDHRGDQGTPQRVGHRGRIKFGADRVSRRSRLGCCPAAAHRRRRGWRGGAPGGCPRPRWPAARSG